MTFVNLKGEVVYNRKEIALNYVSGLSKNYMDCDTLTKSSFTGWFILDLLAALPFDLLYATCMVRTMVRKLLYAFLFAQLEITATLSSNSHFDFEKPCYTWLGQD
jgi:hypothetical protein